MRIDKLEGLDVFVIRGRQGDVERTAEIIEQAGGSVIEQPLPATGPAKGSGP